MARKDDILGVTGAETLIGAGVAVSGQLHGDGDMVIDGTVTGDIKTTGDITIGVNGEITSDLKGSNVIIIGSVRGNITAEGDVSIRETGRVQGNITAASLSITPGGLFNGRNTIRKTDVLEPTEPSDQT